MPAKCPQMNLNPIAWSIVSALMHASLLDAVWRPSHSSTSFTRLMLLVGSHSHHTLLFLLDMQSFIFDEYKMVNVYIWYLRCFQWSLCCWTTLIQIGVDDPRSRKKDTKPGLRPGRPTASTSPGPVAAVKWKSFHGRLSRGERSIGCVIEAVLGTGECLHTVCTHIFPDFPPTHLPHTRTNYDVTITAIYIGMRKALYSPSFRYPMNGPSCSMCKCSSIFHEYM